MKKALNGVPNYRRATDPKKSCDTCSAFKSGYCKMFYVPVEASYTCSDWKAK